MNSSSAGPLGPLRGMYFDPERNRYFPIPPKESPVSQAVSQAALSSTRRSKSNADANNRPKSGRPGDAPETSKAARKRILRSLRSRDPRCHEERVTTAMAGMILDQPSDHLCRCEGERITWMKSAGPQGIIVTTDHGKVIMDMGDEIGYVYTVCPQKIIGMNINSARGHWVAVSGGADGEAGPHIHAWRRDHLSSSPMFVPSVLEFPLPDIYAMATFDDRTTLASSKSLITVQYGESMSLRKRRLPLGSDPLSLDHASRDIVFAGVRRAQVLLEDLRLTPRMPNIVAELPTPARAVVRVKRLQDSAVPWGLVASAMGHQMLLFDIRFPRRPVRSFEGHVNDFHMDLGFATSPDDTVLFAGGSDKRLRAWSTVTGERLQPPTKDPHHALSMTFGYVDHVDVAQDLTLRVASGGEVFTFSPYKPKGRGVHWQL